MKRVHLPFWDRVTKGATDECWPWTGYVGPSGHGMTSLDSLPLYASRKAWILTHGPIRGGLCVNHKSLKVCALQAICCNPDHMYLGSRAENMVDRWTNTSADERGAHGRPYVLTSEQMQRLWEMRRNGGTLAACAKEFGVHRATVGRYITAQRKLRILKLRSDRLSEVAKVTI